MLLPASVVVPVLLMVRPLPDEPPPFTIFPVIVVLPLPKRVKVCAVALAEMAIPPARTRLLPVPFTVS